VSASAVLTPLPVLIPLLGAAATMFAGRRPRLQRGITLAALTAVVAVCGVLLYLTDRDGTLALHVGGWAQSVPGMGPLGITLVVDRLSALMLVVSSIVLLAVVFYAIGQGIRDGGEHQPVSIFLPTYLALSAGVCNAFLAGDLFNLFVGFEVLLAASFVLLTIGASTERVRVGISYVMVSMVSSMIFLIGIALVYAATGTLNMAEVALRLDGVSPGTRSALFAVLLVAFGIKAAVFPLSTWLPDSYPTAPAPVTAVFAGLLTKVGVYAIIRAHTLLFPGAGLDRMLMVAAFLTMIVGILGAIAQSDIKRLLSFTLVSHIGYMVFGVALSSQLGMSGAIFYVAHHILVQTTLFLVVGLIERQAGGSTLQRLGGLAAASPVLAFVFVVPALNLGGVPPLSGFIGKVALLEAGAQSGSVLAWLLVGGSVVTSLLTLYVVSRVWTLAFWRTRADAPEGHLAAAAPSVLLDDTEDIALDDRLDVGRMPIGMLAPTGALIVVGLTLTVLAGPIFSYADRAAAEVLDRGRYISAVLGEAKP
jgi:multicomponent Na+:H+ antiporter subunit D